MAWTKNGTRKIILLRLIGIILVCFINNGASNAKSCQEQVAHGSSFHLHVANCVAKGFAHQLSL